MKRWLIPNDWNESDGYTTVAFCIPNSRMWRGLVTGIIRDFSFGWSWDESSGRVTQAQEFGREIFNSMVMNPFDGIEAQLTQINFHLARIALAQESIDSKTNKLYTFSEFSNDLDNSTLTWLKPVVETFVVLFDLIPSLDIQLSAADWLRTLMDFLKHRQILSALNRMAFSLQALVAVESGETAAEAASTAVEALDQITDEIAMWLGVMAEGSAVLGPLSAWLDLWSNSGADGDSSLRSNVRGLENIFIQSEAMKTIINNIVNVDNCCGDNAFFGTGSSANSTIDTPIYTLPVSPTIPPNFTDDTDFDTYRCQAANAMMLGIAEGIANFSNQKNIAYNSMLQEQTAQEIYNFYEQNRVYLDELTNGYLPYEEAQPLYHHIFTWQANVLAWFWHYGENQEAFDILSDIRLLLLSDRQQFVCNLYEATSTDDARSRIQSLVDGYISGLTYDSEVKQYAGSLVVDSITNNYINKLWQKDSRFENYTDQTAIDCSVCGSPPSPPLDPQWTCAFLYSGTWAGGNIFNSEDMGDGTHKVYLLPNRTGNQYADTCDSVPSSILTITGGTFTGAYGNSSVQLHSFNPDSSMSIILAQSTIPTGAYNAHSVWLLSTTAFQLTLTPQE